MTRHTRDEILRKIVTSGRVVMTGADLSGLDLSGLMLIGADLSYTDLTDTDLCNATLSGASLWSSCARGARFRGANLVGANLGLSVLVGADLRDAQLRNADLTGAQMDGADLTGADMGSSWLDAMQRALAIGAPTLRFSEAPHPRTRVLHQADMGDAVTMRCGDRLELRFKDMPRRYLIQQMALPNPPVLTAPRPDGAGKLAMTLTFVAAAPGCAHLRIGLGQGLQSVEFDVQVAP